MNQIKTIFPYRSNGLWKLNEGDDEWFDWTAQESSEYEIEPHSFSFAIDKILGHIGIKTDKIKITFSINKFPKYDVKMNYVCLNIFGDGAFYHIYDSNFDLELFLSPSILAWFGIDEYDDVEEIYMKFEEYK